MNDDKNDKPVRDDKGHFLPGNKVAKGNPYAKQIAQFRAAIYESVTVNDIEEIITKTIDLAKAGDRAARDFLFDRLLGKAVQPIEATVDATLSPEQVRAKIDSMLGLTSDEKPEDGDQ